MAAEDNTRSAIFARLGELPTELFPASFITAVGLVEDYGRAWALELAHRLELGPRLVEAASPAQLVDALGFLPRFTFAMDWLLGSLVDGGWAERRNNGGVAARAQLAVPARAALREEILALSAGHAATLDLLDAAGEAFIAIGRGARSGEEVLLGPAGMSLWARYFANENALYAINNAVVSLAAANRLPEAGPFSVLEVGAGGGSGAEALLVELKRRGSLGRLISYQLTEPSPFFRRRSQRNLGAAWPGLPLTFGDLDIDRPWADQGGAAGSLDLVYGVNVLHVAKRLDFSLSEAHRVLKPGGWLVIGECVRPYPGRAIAAELVFGLLEGFTAVELAADHRPNPGFLTAGQWRGALRQAGFDAVTVVPDVEAIAGLTSNFLTAAICARREHI